MIPVLWVTQVYPRSESDIFGSFLHRLARELPARGYSVRVLAPGADGVPDAETRDGVEIVRFPYAPEGRRTVAYTGEMHRAARRHPWRFVRFLGAFRRSVREQVRELRPSLLHAHWWIPSAWAAMSASRASGIPMAVSVHGTDLRLLSGMPLARPVARSVLRGANVVLPVSSDLQGRIESLVGGELNQQVLPMPADPDTFYPGPASAGGDPRFVIAARLTTQKRVDLAIRAVAALKAGGTPVVLQIAGDGPERHALQSLAAELGVESAVEFHGMVPDHDLAGLFRGAAAAVLSSENEGYGLAIVEAALCQTPAIGTRSGGIRDLIDTGVTGLAIPPGDVAALAEAMRTLANDADLRARMGRAARERAAAATPAPLAERLTSVYVDLVRR